MHHLKKKTKINGGIFHFAPHKELTCSEPNDMITVFSYTNLNLTNGEE